MFESAELGHRIDKATYEKELPALREALLEMQYELLQSKKFPVVILIGGVDGAGRGETVNLLKAWMDPRHIETHAMGSPSDEESSRPPMWRFWRALPPKGKIGIFFGTWYTQPILSRVFGKIKNADLDQSTDQIVRFEHMLAAEGALILKFWMHLSKDAQRKRLKALEKDPKTRWRVSERDWLHFKMYDRFRKTSERVLRQTSTGDAPWIVVEGEDERYRSLRIGRIVHDAIHKRLEQEKSGAHAAISQVAPFVPGIDRLNVLESLDYSLKVEKKAYETELEQLQGRLALLTRNPKFRNIAVVSVFEGFDAAGKGGAIRRITGALDARQYDVIPVAAPTEEERAQPYLWRFWRHIPRTGQFRIFDRSWYGRVLVERVEGFCSENDWMRAYAEINDFEEQLSQNGIVIVKFWLAITKDEQKRRFEERQNIAFKRFKITDEDWRNREKWDDYVSAVCDMVDRTSTEIAPWTLIEANDKNFARLKVLRTLCERIEAAL